MAWVVKFREDTAVPVGGVLAETDVACEEELGELFGQKLEC